MLYSAHDYERVKALPCTKEELKLRPPFWRDYARLIHSPAFRRLQGKTQLFPGVESDFFRNRLTHSLEVSQIAKSLAMRINNASIIGKKDNELIDLDLVTLAGLTHDLGHPPFGHNGELALDDCMKNHGGFEGNAQTLRILSKLEKKGDNVLPFSGKKASDSRVGLNLTYRTLAAILKYDQKIPLLKEDRPKKSGICKGYYASEADLVGQIKKNVIGSVKYKGKFKTIECQIMDLADDIAYSTYDLEDALKAGFTSPIEIISDTLNHELMERIAEVVSSRTKEKFEAKDIVINLLTLFFDIGLFPEEEMREEIERLKAGANYALIARRAVKAFASSALVTSNGYFRNELTSSLVDKFINGVEVEWNPKAPAFSTVQFSEEIFPLVETLKNYTYVKFIDSSRLKIAEYRGYRIVKKLFDTLSKDGGPKLLPTDFKQWYDKAPNETERKRVICDFIAGMTDTYIMEFYGRLNSENPQTMFKPI